MPKRQRGLGWQAAILFCAVLCIAAAVLRADTADLDWSYCYVDDFGTTQAQTDSLNHSLFWLDPDVTPLEPCLYYMTAEDQTNVGLAFMGSGDATAYLEYRFPLDAAALPNDQRIGGTIDFDVRPLAGPMQGNTLFYSLSPNGQNWTRTVKAVTGHNQAWVASADGAVYIRFFGRSGVLDNLRVRLQHGVIYHVNNRANAEASHNGLSNLEPFLEIQTAIDLTQEGDRVYVWPGTYRDRILFPGHPILVRSIGDAAVLQAPNDYAVSFYSGQGPRSTLRNFVICNSYTGIFIAGSSPTLSHLTIAGNQRHAIHAAFGADPQISNCIFWNHPDGDLVGCQAQYSCLQDRSDGQPGNIQADPLFADPNRLDYHLKSQRGRLLPPDPNQTGPQVTGVWITDPVTSPCIDAGDPALHPRAERMPNGGRINMGAYGGTTCASLSVVGWPKAGDRNYDGIVNLFDYALAAGNEAAGGVAACRVVLRDWLWQAPWYNNDTGQNDDPADSIVK